MRKPATRLLAIGLFFLVRSFWSGGVWAQQAATQPNLAHPDSSKPDSGKAAQSEPVDTLKVDVKLVNVYVTVTDAHGAPIAGLTKDNFIVQEDGHDQKISVFDKESAVPLSIALAIDTSLSTRH